MCNYAFLSTFSKNSRKKSQLTDRDYTVGCRKNKDWNWNNRGNWHNSYACTLPKHRVKVVEVKRGDSLDTNKVVVLGEFQLFYEEMVAKTKSMTRKVARVRRPR